MPGICYKSEKASDETSSGDRISGNDSQLKEMTIFLPPKKLELIKQICQDVYQNPDTTVLESMNVLNHLISTILAILPEKIHRRFLQQHQIQALKKNDSYKSQAILNKEYQLELLWWVKNIKIYDGRTLIQLPAQALSQILRSQVGGRGQPGKG